MSGVWCILPFLFVRVVYLVFTTTSYIEVWQERRGEVLQFIRVLSSRMPYMSSRSLRWKSLLGDLLHNPATKLAIQRRFELRTSLRTVRFFFREDTTRRVSTGNPGDVDKTPSQTDASRRLLGVLDPTPEEKEGCNRVRSEGGVTPLVCLTPGQERKESWASGRPQKR